MAAPELSSRVPRATPQLTGDHQSPSAGKLGTAAKANNSNSNAIKAEGSNAATTHAVGGATLRNPEAGQPSLRQTPADKVPPAVDAALSGKAHRQVYDTLEKLHVSIQAHALAKTLTFATDVEKAVDRATFALKSHPREEIRQALSLLKQGAASGLEAAVLKVMGNDHQDYARARLRDIARVIESTAGEAADFGLGVAKGLSPVPGALPAQPTFGHRAAFQAGEPLGQAVGLVIDAAAVVSGGIIAGGGGALAVLSEGALASLIEPAVVTGAALAGAGLVDGRERIEKLRHSKPENIVPEDDTLRGPQQAEAISFEKIQNSGKQQPRDRTMPSRPKDPNAVARGKEHQPTKKMDDRQRGSLKGEVEAADTLAKEGFDVEWLSDKKAHKRPNEKNPDLRVEGKIFDVYTPRSANLSQILQHSADKVRERQTQRVILDLRFDSVNMQALEKEFIARAPSELKEVIAVRKGKIFYFELRKTKD